MVRHFSFVMCSLLFLTVGSNAAPIIYSINFELLTGTLTPSGEFTYDAASPLGSQFSNFVVMWGADTFNLTASANNPALLGSGDVPNPCYASANSAGVFQALSNPSACASGGATGWTAQAASTNDEFAWFFVPPSPDPSTPASSTLFISDLIYPGTSPIVVDASGLSTISQTPEPRSSIMFGLGLGLTAMVLVIRLNRMNQRQYAVRFNAFVERLHIPILLVNSSRKGS